MSESENGKWQAKSVKIFSFAFARYIFLEPREEAAPHDTVWTDGSLGDSGGAAAFQADSDLSLKCHVPSPRSSTQCELVAFTLVAHFQRQPPLVLSDSLCALQLLRSWGTRSTNKVLYCPERAEVRQFLRQWAGQRAPHTLEMVNAHDSAGVRSGSIKAYQGSRSQPGLQGGSALRGCGSLSGLFGGNDFISRQSRHAALVGLASPCGRFPPHLACPAVF